MNQRYLVTASFLLGIILVFGIFNLQVDSVIAKVIFWTVFGLALTVTVAVGGNLIWALRTMYKGYRPGDGAVDGLSADSQQPTSGLPFANDKEGRDSGNDVLLELCRAECALANVETSASLESLSQKQKRLYYHALKEIQTLVLEVSRNDIPEKVA